MSKILVTVLMPCLNESRTLAACIERAHAGCLAAREVRCQRDDGEDDVAGYEILVADNGSTDGSPEIARACGARVETVRRTGYGAALRGGIAAAQGKYVVMGDSDGSYDFGEVPRFLAKLEDGYDLVLGNRFVGGIAPGAMPWHHRYIGNPLLSGLGRLLYRTTCRDWHCGLRGFDREKILALDLRSDGMEFASEMVIRAVEGGLSMAEIPVCLQPDGRDRPPHLRSLRDGVRHLRVLFGKRRRAGGVRMHLVAFLVGCAAVLLGLWIMNTPRGGPIAFDVPETVVLSKDEFVGKVLKIPCKISSSEPVDIVGARTSCGCIRVNGLPRRIEPRATESVDIELNVADFKRMFREKGLPLMARYRIEYLVVDHDPVEQIVTISVQDDRRRR